MTRALGVFGGSFDPVHYGHLRVAEEAREELRLDRVLFVPAASPPHKPDHHLADAADRLEMVRLAVRGNPAFEASPIDVDRGGTSYSVDLLEELERSPAGGGGLHFLVGADAFREMGSWHRYERIFELAHVVVLSRPTDADPASPGSLPVAARSRFCYQTDTGLYRHSGGKFLRFLSVTALDVSATDIRRRVRDGRSIRYLVPDAVASFLHQRRLYEPTPTSWTS